MYHITDLLKKVVSTTYMQGDTDMVENNSSYRKRLIIENRIRVTKVAYKMFEKTPPNVLLDDLISSGNIGLVDAAKKFDETRGIKFESYVDFRIKGAMIDEIRKMDVCSRHYRKLVSLWDRAFEELTGKLERPPNDDEMSKALRVDLKKYSKIKRDVHFFKMLSSQWLLEAELSKIISDDFSVYNNLLDPADIIEKEEIMTLVKKQIETLSIKDKKILFFYYTENFTMKHIGSLVNLTEGAVCTRISNVKKIIKEAIIKATNI